MNTLNKLLDEAFALLAHDADEHDRGTKMQRKSLEEKFSRILRDCSGSGAERSGVLQGCLPSTTGSASAADALHEAMKNIGVQEVCEILNSPKAGDETGVDNE